MRRRAKLNILPALFVFLPVMVGTTFAGQIIYVDAANGNDDSNGLAYGVAFATIQKGIEVATDGDTVIVLPGLYLETDPLNDDNINFLGKNITLTSIYPANSNVVESTIIRGYVQFAGTEDANCMLTGFSIKDPYDGAIYGNGTGATISHCVISGNGPCSAIVVRDCDGTISNCLITDNTYSGCGPPLFAIYECGGLIKNCTIANNASGVSISGEKILTMENCIIYNNGGSQIQVLSESTTLDISYCDLQDGLEGIAGNGTVNWGLGNIDAAPYFVDTANRDYHLKSQGWSWSEYLIHGSHWTYDYVSSRCIDAGNPGSPLDDELLTIPDDPNHLWGVNLRINMGAFGGTAQASMPPYDWVLLGDLTNDGTVGYEDLAWQIKDWLTSANEKPGDLNRDGIVNMIDFAMLADGWLQMTDWAE